jgi:DNA-binding NarL/FixJ family response regulator
VKTELQILIADDHPIFRQGLKQVIEREKGFVVVAEAENGEVALERIVEFKPQVAILDIDMPRKDGFDVIRAINEKQLQVEVIFLTMHKDEMHFNEAISLGAKGFVVKDSVADDLVHCITAVAAGQNYISPVLSSLLLTWTSRARSVDRKASALDKLTPTERQVLLLLAEYKTSKEIASALGVSPRTIENHRSNICTKLELQGTHALVKFAAEHKEEIAQKTKR